MTPRLDALRIDTTRLDTAGREAASVESAQRRPINRPRLNGLEKASAKSERSGRSSETAFHDPESSAPVVGFREQSLDQALEDFIAPGIPDPTIVRRSVSILQHCVDDLVPNLNGGEQLHDLATTLLEEEIERHRDLLRLLQGGAHTD